MSKGKDLCENERHEMRILIFRAEAPQFFEKKNSESKFLEMNNCNTKKNRMTQ